MTFEEFTRSRLPALLRFAKALCVDRGTAEDVVQEVLLRAQLRSEAIESLDDPGAYVRRMIVNEYLSWRRKWARMVPHAAPPDPGAAPDPADSAADRALLISEIARLPRRQRAALVLRYFGGLSDADIAADLGCSEGTVRSHVSRALSACGYRSLGRKGWKSPMNASLTEDDLRAALVELSQNAPAPADVLPDRDGVGRSRRRYRWLAPAAAAAVAAAVGISVALIGHQPAGPPAAGRGDLAALLGVQWQLRAVGGRAVVPELPLQIEPNGRFGQNLGQCSSLLGHAELTPTQVEIQRVRFSGGLCPAPREAPSPEQQRRAAATVKAVRGTLSGILSWAVRGRTLVLSRPGALALSYTRARHSPVRTRQWTFHGVGITLPRAWPKNALRCATPITDTVIYPGNVNYCWARRPAGVSAVQFAPYRHVQSVLATQPGQPAHILVDGVPALERNAYPHSGPYRGLHVIEMQIPSHNASIVISTPNGTEALQLSAAIYIPGH